MHAAGAAGFAPRAKRALELPPREALSVRSKRIGSEHLLLELLRYAAAGPTLVTYSPKPGVGLSPTASTPLTSFLAGPRRVLRMDDEKEVPTALSRRAALTKLGGLAAAALGGGAWAALDEDEADAAAGGPAAVASGAVTCVLTPELTEGPYYIEDEKLRRNITEGKPGARLLLRLTVVDASTCKPIKGAAVDVWHADASGVYSGFGAGASSRTFMRGIQNTDAKGLAVFQTVYPGWYPGRTVHIHVKVHVGGNVVRTGQIFFSDTMTDAVYRRAPYRARPNRTTRNANDSIYVNGGSKSILAVKSDGKGGYVGRLTMGVSRR